MGKWQLQAIQQQMWIAAGAIAATGAVVGVQLTGSLQPMELSVLDQGFRWRPSEAVDDRIVLVTMQESDLALIGQYPLSDGILATLLKKIRQQQPRVIGLDLYRNLPIQPGHEALRQVYATTPNLIAIEKTLSTTTAPAVEPPSVLRDRNQVAASDLVLDPDGRLRRNLLSLRVSSAVDPRGRTIDTLGTRLAVEYLKSQNIVPQKGSDNAYQLGRARLIPLDRNAGGYVHGDTGGFQILSNFRNLRRKFASVSITDVLRENVPPKLFHDRIVLIGSTAESLNDRFFTPYTINLQSVSAGVEIHADLASQLISGAIDGRPLLGGVSQSIELSVIFVCASLGTVVGLRVRSPRRAIGLTFLIVIAVAISAYSLFLAGWWLPLVAPILGLAIAAGGARGYLIWRTLHRSHQALQRYAETLEHKVQTRTEALVQQNQILAQTTQEAQAASRAKSAFLANVNHELRTPLSIILSTSELLSYDKTLNPKQKERLATINHSVQHLLDLINNVLELAKLEADAETLNVEQVWVPDLLQNIMEMLYPEAAAKGVLLRIENLTTSSTIRQSSYLDPMPDSRIETAEFSDSIHTDERKLRQVLINLLNNAIKFTHQGSIVLRVKWLYRSSRLAFEVEDTGVGIAPHEIDSLFKAFAQTEAGRRSGKGTGLGLSISQQYVRLLGGELQVHSTIGVGTRFWFDLPTYPSCPLNDEGLQFSVEREPSELGAAIGATGTPDGTALHDSEETVH